MTKILTGVVVSDKAAKTIVVRTQTHKTHPIYRKRYLVTKRYAVHDEKNEARVGDKVNIQETRPLSATKRFKLEKIVDRPLIREEESVDVITAEEKPEEPKEDKVEKPIAKPRAKKAVTKKVSKEAAE